MVNINTANESLATYSNKFEDNFLFKLSKPTNLTTNALNKSTKMDYNNLLLNTSSFNFTFVEPFESSHTNKITNKLHVRSHPYNVAKNTANNSNNNFANTNNFLTANDVKLLSTNGDHSNSFANGNSHISIVSNGSANNTSINKNSNSNPLLARLSNISSTFKSIFVRPKSTKPVDLASICSHKSQLNEANSNNKPTKFKLQLFSTDDTKNETLANDTDIINSEIINKEIENIITQNVQAETAANNSRGRNAPDSLLSNKLFNHDQSSNSSTKSTISTLSTTSNLTKTTTTSETHQRAIQMTTKYQSTTNGVQHQSTSTSLANSTSNAKWTCLICLSKHRLDVKVCPICGSLQQTKPNAKLVKLEPTTNVLSNISTANNLLSSSLTSANPLLLKSNNNFLNKTWTCNFCNYANDCLKIVCMNCRSSKQLSQQQTNSIDLKFTHHTVQMKRKNKEAIPAPSSSITNKLNTSNEENELDIPTNSTNKKTKYCSSCTKSVCDNKNKLGVSIVDESEKSTLITPIKPANYFNEPKMNTPLNVKESNAQSSSSVAATAAPAISTTTVPIGEITTSTASKTAPTKISTEAPLLPLSALVSKKWTCLTCLVQNDEAKDTCACCCTKKPSNLDQTDSSKRLEAPKETKPLSSLSSNSSKWTCSTCLVSNDADKAECACCLTKRDPSDKTATKTKFSTLVPASANTSNISFGLKSSTSSEPVKFITSSFGSFGSSTAEKPTISFGSSTSQEKTAVSFGSVTSEKPAVSFGSVTSEKPAVSFGSVSSEKPAVSFGSVSSDKPFSFGKPSESVAQNIENSAKPVEESKPMSFGSTSSMSLFATGSSSSSTTQPVLSFGQTTFGAKNETNVQEQTKSTLTFGQTPSLFNQQTSAASTTSSDKPSSFQTTSLFGSTQPTFGFNSQQQQQQQPQQVTSTPSLFGNQSNSLSTSSEANKPSFGFLNSATSTKTASAMTSESAPKPSFGLFGNSSTSQANTFGSSNVTTSDTSSKSLFSSTSTTKTDETAKQANAPTLFGSSTTTSDTGFKFGSSASAPSFVSNSSNTTGSSLFGNTNNSTTAQSQPPSAFGSNETKQNTENKTNSSSLLKFGFTKSTNNNSQESATASNTNKGFFGQSSSENSISSANKGSIFGQGASTLTSTTSAPSNTTSSLFAFSGANKDKPAESKQNENTGSVFGQSSSSSVFGSGFGASSSTTTTTTTTVKTEPKPFVFGSGTNTASTGSTFGSSSTNNTASSSPFVFGGSSVTNAPATVNNSSNVFGSLLNSTKPTQPAFGQPSTAPTNTSNSSTAFVFGSSQAPDTNKTSGFNFGNQTSAFTFGSDMNSTPSKSNQLSSASPFVFSATNQTPNIEGSNLQQVLTPTSTTPSSRLIKKPTRRLKK